MDAPNKRSPMCIYSLNGNQIAGNGDFMNV